MKKKIEEAEIVTTIAEYSATEKGLALLREKLKGAKYEVTTTAGLELAKKDRREVVTLRTTLEATRKEIKAPALARCQMIDAEAKRITAELLALELPIDAQIKIEEDRKAEIKRLKEAAELERVTKIKERIAVITGIPLKLVNVPNSLSMRDIIQTVREQVTATEAEFQEWQPMAAQALENTLREMEIIVADKEAAEIEEIRKANEYAEQQKAIAEAEEALRLEREAFEKERAAVQAEAKRVADELQAEQDRIDAERQARQREEDRLRQIENDRIAAEQKAAQERLDAERAEIQRQNDIALAQLREAQEKEAEAARKRIAEQLAIDTARRVELEQKQQAEFVEKMKKPYAALAKIKEICENKELTALAARNQINAVADIALEGKE